MSRNLREVYQRLSRQSNMSEQELARRAWVETNKMLYESSIGPAASSSAAGAGGGSGNKREQPVVEVSLGNAVLFYQILDTTVDFFIYNYDEDKATEIKSINKPENFSYIDSYLIGQKLGFVLLFMKNNDEADIYKIDINGEFKFIDIIPTNNRNDYSSVNRLVLTNENVTYIFSKKGHKKYEFQNNVDIYFLEGNMPKSFFIIKEDLSQGWNYYIIEDMEEAELFLNTEDSSHNFYGTDTSDYFLVRYSTKMEIYNFRNKVNEYVRNSENNIEIGFLSEDTFVDIYEDITGEEEQYVVVYFKGSQNQLSEYRINTIYNINYQLDRQLENSEVRNFINEGSAAILFTTGENLDLSDDLRYYNDIIILPIWSTDLELRETFSYTESPVKGIKINYWDTNVTFMSDKDHINILVHDNPQEDLTYKVLRLNREGNIYDLLETSISTNWSFRRESRLKDFIVFIGRDDEYTPSSGFSDLSDVEERDYVVFRKSLGNEIGDNIIGTDMIMKDVINNQYYKFTFTEWGQGNDTNLFAYNRELIIGGTGSGDIISFNNSTDGPVDVIVPGVIEFRRNYQGGIYNSAAEDEFVQNESPANTLWNSEYMIGEKLKMTVFDKQGVETDAIEFFGYEDEERRGNIFINIDEYRRKTTLVNTFTEFKFVDLEKFYDDYDFVNRYIIGNGVANSNAVLFNKNNFLIVTDSNVTDNIEVESENNWAFGNKVNYYMGTNNLIIIKIYYDQQIEQLQTKLVAFDLLGNITDELGLNFFDVGEIYSANMYNNVFYARIEGNENSRSIIIFSVDKFLKIDMTPDSYINTIQNDYYVWND